MADWNGEISFELEQMAALEAFIHEPDTRRSDIFAQGVLGIKGDRALFWIIKHDLFEGVVLNLSLMTQDASLFLEGMGTSLSQARDLSHSYTIEHDEQQYQLIIKYPDY